MGSGIVPRAKNFLSWPINDMPHQSKQTRLAASCCILQQVLQNATPPPYPGKVSQEESEIALVDPDAGLMKHLPKDVQNALMDAAEESPEFFGLSETELLELYKIKGYRPGPMENTLRTRFWIEYDFMMSQGALTMDMLRVTSGVCTPHFFAKKVLRVPKVASWVTCRPLAYQHRVKDILDVGLRRMRQILELEPGPRDTKLMDLQAKITKMMDDRDQGGVIQRVEQKTQSVQMIHTERTVSHEIGNMTLEALDARLQRLKHEESGLNDILARSSLPVKTAESIALEHQKTEEEIARLEAATEKKYAEPPLPEDRSYTEELA